MCSNIGGKTLRAVRLESRFNSVRVILRTPALDPKAPLGTTNFEVRILFCWLKQFCALQVLSFVSFLFSSCCTDYWDELIQHTPEGESSTVPEKRERVSAPEWGDMLSVLRGYLRLYQGRRFVNLKVRFSSKQRSKAFELGRKQM